MLALATFLVFAGFTPILPTATVVSTLLIGDGLVVITLIVLIGIELARLRSARKAARAGARLHSRFVALFSLVAAIPAIVTAVVATVSVEWAINPRFMSDVAAFINESNQATQLYRESQCRALLRDVELTAGDIARSALLLRSDPEQFKEYFSSRSKTLGFAAAALMKGDGTPIEIAAGSNEKLIARPDPSDFQDALNGEALCGFLGVGNIFVGIRPIPGADGQFLYAARGIDPLAAKVAEDAASVSNMWGRFEAHRHSLELGFATVFVMLALTMLFSAIWLGLAWANRLVGPIRRLIRATDEVASGNLHVQVPTRASDGDLGHLGQTFNKMTSELLRQQTGLIEANALNDERRAFIEAVLSGVPAGVLGVDNDGAITISNAAAERLLGGERGLIGLPLASVHHTHRAHLGTGALASPAPPSGAGDHSARRPRAHSQRQGHRQSGTRPRERHHARRHQRSRHRATHRGLGRRRPPHRPRDQESADPDPALGRKAQAPLRPAHRRGQGRLRPVHRHDHPAGRRHQAHGRRVLVVRADAQGAPGARRPDRLRAPGALPHAGRPCRTSISRSGCRETPVFADFDRRLISQALTNVLKNASEGIDALGEHHEKGKVLVTLDADVAGFIEIAVSDNGKGFPTEDRHRLTEPYVTTRAEGTGLGLPIVVKIFEDHGGRRRSARRPRALRRRTRRHGADETAAAGDRARRR